MNIPGFDAEASLGSSMGITAQPVFSASVAID
jgi:hypothetical protein